IFSIIENASGSIRGAGVSLQPMMLTIFGTVVLRVIWVFAIMPFDPSLEHLLLVYPVTWLITATLFTIYHHSGNWLGRATA
ncbi:MAG: MATE family efflux transporter, partial [Collinsella sp.]